MDGCMDKIGFKATFNGEGQIVADSYDGGGELSDEISNCPISPAEIELPGSLCYSRAR